MKARKFHSVEVSRQCNVSSSGHYHWQVWYRDLSNKRYHRHYCYNVGDPLDFKAPAYLVAEVERLIASDIEAGITRFFEYEQYGSKRFENLRYHDPDYVMKSILPTLKGEKYL